MTGERKKGENEKERKKKKKEVGILMVRQI